jgi:hypothetical protein
MFAYIDPLLQPNFQVQLLGRTLLHAKEFDTVHSQPPARKKVQISNV